MNIKQKHLEQAAKQNIISTEQSKQLWQFLQTIEQNTPSFRSTHILYYLGGLIAIGAMTLFMNLGWERFGGMGLFIIACAYGLLALVFTELLIKKNLLIPAGITAALAVALTPLAVYGMQSHLGFWPKDTSYREYHIMIDWRWIMMELTTLAVGAIVAWRYRLPFIIMPIAVTLWYLSMDITPFLFANQNDFDMWEWRKFVSVWFGLAMLVLAFMVDIRSRHSKDHAFWLYIFGVITFWGGLTAMNSDSEWNKFIYFCINLAMIFIGAVLTRRVFVVCGGLGAAFYIGHLADTIFKDSMLFPVALSLIGFGVIYIGVIWQKNETQITEKLRGLLPLQLRELIESR